MQRTDDPRMEKWREGLATCGQCGHMLLVHKPRCDRWLGRGQTGDVFCSCQKFVRLS